MNTAIQLFDQRKDEDEKTNTYMALTNESPRRPTTSVAQQCFDLQSPQYTKYVL